MLSVQKKETLFPVHKKHFVVLAKERNTVSCAQETLCCLSKRKKHCFLYTRNTLLSVQRKETLFSMHKKHFVVCAKERNTVFYAQETLCCLGKRKKNCFLYIRNTLLSWQRKETLFSMYKKHFVVLAKERNERNTVFCALETLSCLSKRDREQCFFPLLVHRKQCFFLFLRQQSVSCAPNMHWKQFRCLLQWWPIVRKGRSKVLICKRAF